MWIIFDADGDLVGVITELAADTTNILQVLEKANFSVTFVMNETNLKKYSF